MLWTVHRQRMKSRVFLQAKRGSAGVPLDSLSQQKRLQISWGGFFTDLFEALVGQNTGVEFHKFVHKEHIYIYVVFSAIFPYICIHVILRHPQWKKHQPLFHDFSTSKTAAAFLSDRLQEEDVQKLLKSRETSLVENSGVDRQLVSKCPWEKTKGWGSCNKKAWGIHQCLGFSCSPLKGGITV